MSSISEYFRGKTIWITGASSGIGKGFAEELSRLGASVILSSRRKETLMTVQENLKKTSESQVVPLDMENFSMIEKTTRLVLDQGPVDIVILNAGISQRAQALDTSSESEEKIMRTNFSGQVRLAKSVLPSMLEKGSGHLVIISSVAGKIGINNRTSYAASKHALHGYFDSLRAEVARYGITITIICPGYIYTNISSNALTADGSPQGDIDLNSKNGMPVEVFIKKALQGIAKKKSEMLIGGKETLAVYLKRFFPFILRKIMQNRTV